ncbi:MAG: hypothetical protein ACTSU7_00310 [Candidatus Heimdallarchaeaceae archaeon]
MKKKLEILTTEEIRKKAGDWDTILSPELNKHALGLPYDMKRVQRALNHLEAFYAPQVAHFYKNIFDRENEIGGE